MPRLGYLLTFSAAVAAASAACGGEGGETGETAAQRRPAGTEAPATHRSRGVPAARNRTPRPSIDIVRPGGGTVSGPRVTVSVSVRGFDVVEQRVRPPFPRPIAGKGHVHFYLDTKRLPREHGPPATGAYRSTSTTTYTWTGVAPGRHSLAVQLVGKDHVPLSPPVKDRVTVAVE